MWLIFWCVWHGFAWFGMINYGLVSVWSISSKSQFCSWPLIAPPPCVVSVCGWNGPGTPSNITATWLLNFTLYAWNNLCTKCIHQIFGGICENILRHYDWYECTNPNEGITCSKRFCEVMALFETVVAGLETGAKWITVYFRAWVDMVVQRPRQCL